MPASNRATTTILVILSLTPTVAVGQQCIAPGTFVTTTSMSLPRGSHAGALLPDGRVLLAGNDQFTTSAEIFDPVAEAVSPTGSLNIGRCYGCGVTTLPGGNVMLVGGWSGGPVLTSAEVYEPTTGSFRLTSTSMADSRLGPNVTLLPNGQVLATGGHNGFTARSSAELFDPATEVWTRTGSMSVPRLGVAVSLNDGRVLAIGGLTSSGQHLASVEIYDWMTGAFSATGSMTDGRHGHAATRLSDGRVVVTGGLGHYQSAPTLLSSAEIFDPVTGMFSTTGSMSVPRSGHVQVLLSDGKVLVAGGSDGVQTLSSTEVYDPASGTFSAGPSMAIGRASVTVVKLADGRILFSGGYNGNSRLSSMEIFQACEEDTTPPVILLQSRTPANAAGWNNTDVSVTWTCSDPCGSGVVAASITSAVSTEGANQSITGTCSDRAGNTASDTQTGINIDKTNPALAPAVTPTPVLLNGSATVMSGAADALSGLAHETCGALAVSSVGLKTVTCSAVDRAGNVSSAAVSYQVTYRFDGFQQPINDTAHAQSCNAACPISVFKGGSTIPVKFQLRDASGAIVQSGLPPQWHQPTSGGPITEAVDAGDFTAIVNSGAIFQRNGAGYHYNWNTRHIGGGRYWRIGVSLDDGSTHVVYLGLK
jgi:hypothetical protein